MLSSSRSISSSSLVPGSMGHGVIRWTDPRTGVTRITESFNNLVVFEGIDILGKLLAATGIQINMLYMEFNNGGALAIDPDPADGRAYYAGLETDGNDDHGYLRIPLLGAPELTSSDETKFVSNQVTFNAQTQGSAGLRGATEFSTAAGSIVFGIALVAAPDVDDASQDLVFSRSYDFTPHVKLANEEVSIGWKHTFPEEISSSSSS